MSFCVYLTLFSVVFIFVGVKGDRISESDFSTIRPTNGEPWPMPQSMDRFSERVSVHPDSFHFLYDEISQQCDVLTNAFDRYYKLIFYPETYWNDLLEEPIQKKKIFRENIRKKFLNLDDTILLKSLNVIIRQKCEQWPTFESDESCKFIKIINFFLTKFFVIN